MISLLVICCGIETEERVHILTNDKIEYRHFRMWCVDWKTTGQRHGDLEKMKYPKMADRY